MKNFIILFTATFLCLVLVAPANANDEEVVITGLNTSASDPYIHFTRIETGIISMPYLEGHWYSTENPFSIDNSLQIYGGGVNALVYEDESYSLSWQPNQTKWRLIYGNVINQVGLGAGIDYNWTNVINAATENNIGLWSTDFTDISFNKSGTKYGASYQEGTGVVSAPAPLAGSGLVSLIVLLVTAYRKNTGLRFAT